MTNNYQFNLFCGVFLAVPPQLYNAAHELINALSVTAHSSFSQTATLLKVGIVIFGYYLITLSLLQAQNLKEHKTVRFSKHH